MAGPASGRSEHGDARRSAQPDEGAPTLTIDGAIATIRLRRPSVANRLEGADLAVLLEHFLATNADPRVLVLRLRGTGRHFCSGYHIGEIGTDPRAASFEQVADALEDVRPVTIAAINGGVYGGATDLSLACDFRYGLRRSEMFMPAARLGLHYYPRGMQRFVSRLGLNAAKRLFLSAEKLDAERMREIGFLDRILDDDAALDVEVDALSRTIGGMAPIALLGMKKHLNRIARGALDADDIGRDIERAARSEDLREGGLAWKEKRAPRFSGR